MKLMFCGACGDVVSPGQQNYDVRWCACVRHAVWWVEATKGIIRVHDKLMPERNGGAGGKAWIIGLHNEVLAGMGLACEPDVNDVTTKGFVEMALENTPDYYIFKRAHSLVVRMAPGYTSDTAWSQLP